MQARALARGLAARRSLLSAVSRAASTSAGGSAVLEPYLKGNAGARREAPYMSYVDTVRAETLLKAKVHLGHQKKRLNNKLTGQLYGFRHNIAIYDINKTWRSMRTIFYSFAEMAQNRSSFFLLAPNENLPLRPLIERMRKEYPFRYDKFSSLYMVGYADKKWVDGMFSNRKVTFEYARHVREVLEEKPTLRKYRKLRRYLRGIEDVDIYGKVIPDFLLVLATDRGAVHEALNADIPLIGLVDTNTDPAPFLYPVFANDDSLDSIQFVLDLIKRGVEEGRKKEQEAFALLMLRKMKQHLNPATASSSLLKPESAPLLRASAGAGDSWLPKPAAERAPPPWLSLVDANTGNLQLKQAAVPRS